MVTGVAAPSGADFAGWSEMKPLVEALLEYDGACSPTDLADLIGHSASDVDVPASAASRNVDPVIGPVG
ncbi:hypothetical protein GCM10018963_07360 [Saccharothrix longispora]